jgi:hypothetical protein
LEKLQIVEGLRQKKKNYSGGRKNLKMKNDLKGFFHELISGLCGDLLCRTPGSS